jgi:exosortase family protein XrtM
VSALIRKVAVFVLVFSALQIAWQCSTAFNGPIIEKGIVAPAAYAINQLTPDVHAYVRGSHLKSAGSGGINIVNGCDGTELLFLLIAGFAAAPLTTRSRLVGIIIGIPLVYLLNQARILALFYSARRDAEWFDALHGFIAPIVLILIIGAYFYAWTADRLEPARVAEQSPGEP